MVIYYIIFQIINGLMIDAFLEAHQKFSMIGPKVMKNMLMNLYIQKIQKNYLTT